jgi:hypothetical protein
MSFISGLRPDGKASARQWTARVNTGDGAAWRLAPGSSAWCTRGAAGAQGGRASAVRNDKTDRPDPRPTPLAIRIVAAAGLWHPILTCPDGQPGEWSPHGRSWIFHFSKFLLPSKKQLRRFGLDFSVTSQGIVCENLDQVRVPKCAPPNSRSGLFPHAQSPGIPRPDYALHHFAIGFLEMQPRPSPWLSPLSCVGTTSSTMETPAPSRP